MNSGFQVKRQQMVEQQLKTRGITDPRVLAALAIVPREKFVPPEYRDDAYRDGPIPIGQGQSISQPYMVAQMCQLLELTGSEKVMDIGSGSGYQAAVLSQLCDRVYAVEIDQQLGQTAQATLKQLGYTNVKIIVGDGKLGYSPEAPYSAIKVAAAYATIPPAWKKQLVEGGCIVMPLKTSRGQVLVKYIKQGADLKQEKHGSVTFVPLK